jgi:thiamine biosynthesis lipoprotein
MEKRMLCTLLRLLCIVIAFPILSLGCGKAKHAQAPAEKNDYIEQSDFLLNTIVTIRLYDNQDQKLLSECFDRIRQYEKIFSRTDEASELYQLNQKCAQGAEASGEELTCKVSAPLSDLLSYGLYYSHLSDGFFDITIAPLTRIWNFNTASPVPPEDEAVHAALKRINYRAVALKGDQLTLTRQGIEFDLGAIAKGYIADRIRDYLIEQGVKSAIINLGGNVLCIGKKPDHTPFRVGIQKPFADRNETAAVMEIENSSVVSSGIYERFFDQNGTTYHHILNPKTGYPYQNGLISVTIISEKSVDGDGLSTSCFALGLEKGLKLIESLPNTYAVFITEDYKLHYSKDFHDAIHISTE